MGTIVTRIKEYLEFKGISNAAFEKSMGLSNAAFRNLLLKGGSIGSDKLENFITLYPEVSLLWLVKGEGAMLTESPVSLPDPEPTPASDMAMVNRLLQLLEEKERSHAALLEILKEKDETIRQLIIEITALKEKRGDAKNVITSSDANVG